LKIEQLTDLHDVSAFDCGESIMNEYLQRHALKHTIDNYSKTYVAVEQDNPIVIGYHTIAPSSVARELFQTSTPRFPRIGAILLARWATDNKHQGKGIGKGLFVDALKRAYQMVLIGGGRSLEVDALNEKAKNFYLKNGFKQFKDNEMHLYLEMHKLAKLFPEIAQ
jgi:GNAT superfamily N-acetyltransferase